MAFTAGFSVNVGDPTKASDVDVLAANDDYLKNAIDTFIANDANNRVLTATGSGTANAESNLTFDGSTLTVTGTVSATTFNGNVTGDLSGNVTGGTISGSTGSFSGDLAVDTDTLFVDASADRVGIGTTSPPANHQLAIQGNYITGFYRDYADGSSARGYLLHIGAKAQSGTLTAAAVIAGILEGNDTDGLLSFRTLGGGTMTERARITSAGHVGIGTDTPTTFAGYTTLHHKNSSGDVVQLAENDNGVIHQIIASGTDTVLIGSRSNHDLKIGTNDTTAVTIDTSQRVGIGTNSPTTLLELSSSSGPEITLQRDDTSIAANDVVGGIRFSSNDSSTAFGSPPHYGAGIKVKSVGTVGLQNMFFYAGQNNLGYENDTPSMRLDQSGDVHFYDTSPAVGMTWDASASSLGIGTGSPSALIHAQAATSTTGGAIKYTASSVASAYLSASTDGAVLATDTAGIVFRTGITGNDPADTGSERLRIDSSGRVGIGSQSPTYKLVVSNGGAAGYEFNVGGLNGGVNTLTYNRSTSAYVDSAHFVDNYYIYSGQTPAERFRVESTGVCAFMTPNINIRFNGTATQSVLTNNDGVEIYTGGYIWAGRQAASLYLNRAGTTGDVAVFYYNSTTSVGSISVTSSATAYNTSSDYRLKENLAPITGAVDRVNALQPRRFNFISDPDTTVDGFVAHEVSFVVPEAITGEKDAVDEDGNPEYQGIDQSKLVPLLTAAIQELTARIEALEAA